MLPIDVVIPATKKTSELPLIVYQQFLLSGIAENSLHIIHEPLGNANAKRNLGASRGKQPYIFFCDDDVVLMPGTLLKMLGKLFENPAKAYCYCDFAAFNHPCNGNFVHRAGDFNAENLKAQNYISTMSLMRRDAFEAVGGFDPSIQRLQDWDLWLSMLKVGLDGIYLPEVAFFTTYSPTGTTQVEGYKEAAEIVKRKHNL